MKTVTLLVICVVFDYSVSQKCDGFSKRYGSMSRCYTQLIIGNIKANCVKNYDTLEVIMNSVSKRYVTHKCQYSRTKPDEVLPCVTTLTTIDKLEFVECNLIGFDIRAYISGKTVEKIVINDKLFRDIDIYYDVASVKNITYLQTSSRETFNARFSKAMTNVQAFHMDKYSVKDFNSAPFSNLTSLKTLQLVHGSLESVENNFLSGLQHLTVLNLTNNKISNLGGRAFSVVKHLEYLCLGYNKIKRLPNNLFNDAPKLKEFYIQHNPELDRIPQDYFKEAKNLEIFKAPHCGLKFLESSSFQSQGSKLKTLDLSHNELITIQAGCFNSLVNLEYFDISFNPITIFHPTDPFSPSANLKEVIASHCNLTQMPNMNLNKHNLEKLDFSHNNISYASLQVSSKKRTTVLLNDNNIAIINVEKGSSSTSPKYILANNQPRCNCHSKSFIDFLASIRSVKNIFPDITSLYCRGTKNVKVVDIKPSTLKCPSYCPLNCYCLGDTIECRDLELSTPPFPLPPNTKVLHLENNHIDTLTTPDPHYWNKISHLYVSNNSLKSLRNWNVPSGLLGMSVDGNSLKDLPPPLMAKVEKTQGFQIYLAANDWKCDCNFVEIKKWFSKNKDKISDVSESFCRMHSYDKGLIKDVPVDCFCGSSTATDATLITIISIVILVVLAEIIYYYRGGSFMWIRKAGLLRPRLASKGQTGRIHPMESS